MIIGPPIPMHATGVRNAAHYDRENIHMADLPQGVTTPAGNQTGGIYIREDHPGLIFLIALLAGFLLFLIISLVLPSDCQNRLCRLFRGDNDTFNYIDVGLYKTRHSMYRKEIYLQQMRRSIATNTTHSSMSSPQSGRDSDVGTPASSASTERSAGTAPVNEDHLTTIDEHLDERQSRNTCNDAEVDISVSSTLSLVPHLMDEKSVPPRDERCPSALTMSKSDSALRDCCEHCTPRIIVNPAAESNPRKSVIFVDQHDSVFFPTRSGSFSSFV